MSIEELYNTVGGAKQVSGTYINSICKLVTTVLDVGRAIGSALRMFVSGTRC